MLCDKCHERVATILLAQKIGDKEIKLYLCEKCADDTEGAIINNDSFQQFLSGSYDTKAEHPKSDILTCSKCGMTINEFKKTSKIGCSNCYNTFYGYLQSIFKRIHGNTKHTGKRPEKLAEEFKTINNINKMQKELKLAIAAEAYEEAARLRDAIRALKKEAGI